MRGGHQIVTARSRVREIQHVVFEVHARRHFVELQLSLGARHRGECGIDYYERELFPPFFVLRSSIKTRITLTRRTCTVLTSNWRTICAYSAAANCCTTKSATKSIVPRIRTISLKMGIRPKRQYRSSQVRIRAPRWVRTFENVTFPTSRFVNRVHEFRSPETVEAPVLVLISRSYSGDVNVNQNLAIALFQNLFLRFHNYVAGRLRLKHPRWTDETTYQETRRIVAAVIQVITYDHFLPIILGKESETRSPFFFFFFQNHIWLFLRFQANSTWTIMGWTARRTTIRPSRLPCRKRWLAARSVCFTTSFQLDTSTLKKENYRFPTVRYDFFENKSIRRFVYTRVI